MGPTDSVSLPPRAAFVVGMMRSGTSLLKALLEGHPRVMALPRESKTARWCGEADPVAALFEHTRYRRVFPEGSPEREAFEAMLRERLPGPKAVVPAIRALAETMAALRPAEATAEVWIEKTPDHLLHVPGLIEEFGPGTRIVCALRDPRAQAASRALRWKLRRPFRVTRFARRWAEAEEMIRRYEARCPGFLVVRYEEVVRETRDTMERVASHLGIEFDERLLVPMRDEGSWWGNSSYREKRSGVSAISLDRYREQLTPDRIREIEDRLRPRMIRRAYEPDSPGGGALRRLVLEVRARHAASRRLRRAFGRA